MLYAVFREEERRRFKEEINLNREFIINYMECENDIVEEKIQERVKKLRFQNEKTLASEYSFIESSSFTSYFFDFFKILKKCQYIINEAYITWIGSIQQEIFDKLNQPLQAWKR